MQPLVRRLGLRSPSRGSGGGRSWRGASPETSAACCGAVQRAVLHGAAGELDVALEHLDQALDLRDPGLVYLAVAPQWDSLRDDRRFADRLKRRALHPV